MNRSLAVLLCAGFAMGFGQALASPSLKREHATRLIRLPTPPQLVYGNTTPGCEAWRELRELELRELGLRELGLP